MTNSYGTINKYKLINALNNFQMVVIADGLLGVITDSFIQDKVSISIPHSTRLLLKLAVDAHCLLFIVHDSLLPNEHSLPLSLLGHSISAPHRILLRQTIHRPSRLLPYQRIHCVVSTEYL